MSAAPEEMFTITPRLLERHNKVCVSVCVCSYLCKIWCLRVCEGEPYICDTLCSPVTIMVSDLETIRPHKWPCTDGLHFGPHENVSDVPSDSVQAQGGAGKN